MEKMSWKVKGLVFMTAVLLAAGGCIHSKRSAFRNLTGKPVGETITEEELESLGISPELSARGIVFAETDELRTVYFGYNRSDIKPFTRKMLDENAGWLKKNPKIKVQIEGHCDERGTVDYNLALGQRRASTVRRYLVALGISPSRLYTISYGEEQPVDSGHDESSWAKNRRAEFKVKAR